MHDQRKFLFEGISTYDVIRQIQVRAMDQLKATDENTILQTPADDLIVELLAAYALDFPELRDGDTWVDEKEVTREVPIRDYDIYTDLHHGIRTLTFHLVYFHVPFDGTWACSSLNPAIGPCRDLRPT